MVPSVGVPRLADDEIVTEEDDDIPLLPMRCLFWGLGGGEFRAVDEIYKKIRTCGV